MTGTLTLCGTPIGNLEDISARVLRILAEADIIAAEDTRHTIKLLNHFKITTPMMSYHAHNQGEAGRKICSLLEQGRNVALVTDAGMPGISDPGQQLVALCRGRGIPVTAAPGPTALATAVALSGMVAKEFVFLGFLPQQKKERAQILESVKDLPMHYVLYEAPHHLAGTIEALRRVLGERKLSLLRELTKVYEETQEFADFTECLAALSQVAPRGEYVIVVAGANEVDRVAKWENVSISDHVNAYIKQGQDKKDALKSVARDLGISKSRVYNALLRGDDKAD